MRDEETRGRGDGRLFLERKNQRTLKQNRTLFDFIKLENESDRQRREGIRKGMGMRARLRAGDGPALGFFCSTWNKIGATFSVTALFIGGKLCYN